MIADSQKESNTCIDHGSDLSFPYEKLTVSRACDMEKTVVMLFHERGQSLSLLSDALLLLKMPNILSTVCTMVSHPGASLDTNSLSLFYKTSYELALWKEKRSQRSDRRREKFKYPLFGQIWSTGTLWHHGEC